MVNARDIRRVVVLGMVYFGVFPPGATHALSFTITDLGVLDGVLSQGFSINDSGQVTGNTGTYNFSTTQAFLYDGTTMHGLGTLGGTRGSGADINASGHIVGASLTSGDLERHGFYYDGTTMVDFGTLGGANNFARGINDHGQITGGSSYAGSLDDVAYIYESGVWTVLGTLGGDISSGHDINNSGHVVGVAETALGRHHAFLYDGVTMHDIGTLGGDFSRANAISENGFIVGTSEVANGDHHAFLYDGTTMIDLGVGRYSDALGVNDLGQVVGRGGDGLSTNGPFLYDERLGGAVALNDYIDPLSGWNLAYAYDINNLGQITGHGTINGQRHAYILTPVDPIPEPATAVLLGLGLLGLAYRRSSSGATAA